MQYSLLPSKQQPIKIPLIMNLGTKHVQARTLSSISAIFQARLIKILDLEKATAFQCGEYWTKWTNGLIQYRAFLCGPLLVAICPIKTAANTAKIPTKGSMGQILFETQATYLFASFQALMIIFIISGTHTSVQLSSTKLSIIFHASLQQKHFTFPEHSVSDDQENYKVELVHRVVHRDIQFCLYSYICQS